MKHGGERPGPTGVQFFAKMSASIAHDIKNVLAVINENAGLLDDLCLMAEKGKSLDPARVKRVAGDLKSQIRRGDQIITALHRFAHSADSESMTVELGELLSLLAALALRFASMQGVSLQVQRPDAAIEVTTSPFVLLNLLWLCLEYSMAAAGAGKRVELSAGKSDDCVWLGFQGLDGISALGDSFPSEPEDALCRSLGACIRIDSDTRSMAVTLVKKS